MDTSLDRIRAKITQLEEKLVSLRIAERELHELDRHLTPTASKPIPAPKPLPAPKTVITSPKAEDSGSAQTIGATIADILSHHGTLSVKGIGEQIATAGRDINNRAVSFALQAMKKRGLVKSKNGEWTLMKGRSKRAS